MPQAMLLFAALATVAPALALATAAPGSPLPWGLHARSRHAPYAEGSCISCHERKGPDPGPPPQGADELCISCHEEIQQHAHAFAHCSKCHNAHDSERPRLLRADLASCPDCHDRS